MNTSAMFTINEIVGVSTRIPLPNNENDTFENVANTLQIGKFRATTTHKADFINSVDTVFARLTFAGQGFSFGLSKKKFSAQFLRGFEFIDPGLDMHTIKNQDPSELFATENLERISTDFNYILGLILGKLNFDKDNYDFTFAIKMSKKIPTTQSLNHLLTPKAKMIFGKNTNLKLNGINIEISEKLFDAEVQSGYNIHGLQDKYQSTNSYDVDAEFTFKHFGPVDFSKLINESIIRLNSLTMSIMEGADDSMG